MSMIQIFAWIWELFDQDFISLAYIGVIIKYITNFMTLEQKDFESIERVIFKNSDDIAVSISRSFERLEERVDALEARIFSRIGDVDDKIEASRQDLSDDIGSLRDEIREFGAPEEEGLWLISPIFCN